MTLAGITRHPTEQWMVQMARNATDEIDGVFRPIRFALHDRDSKFCASFQATLRSGGVEPVLLPARSPNLNAFAERWVRYGPSKPSVSPSGSCSAKPLCDAPALSFWNIITGNETTKAKATFSSSPLATSTERVTEQP